MNRFLAAQLDRWVIWLACRAQRRQPVLPPRDTGREAAGLLAGAAFLKPLETPPEDLIFTDAASFEFSSSVTTPWAENNRVYGRWLPAGPDWKAGPSVALLHGWNAEFCYEGLFPRMAETLKAAGISVVLLQLPYHGRRRPRSPGAIRDFISDDLARMVEATAQALADVQSILNWLSAQGARPGGVWGFSLGAWLGGLLACIRPALAFAVLATPVCRLEETISTLAFCGPIRESLRRSPLDLSSLSLLAHQPCAQAVLIQEAAHDQFVSPASTEALGRAWPSAELWRLNHGHISILTSRRLARDTAQWIASRAAAS